MKRLYLVFLLLSGCSTATDPAPQPISSPKTGSTFAFQFIEFDNGGNAISGSVRSINHRVFGLDVQHRGKKATHIIENSSNSIFLSYLLNGDVAMAREGVEWEVLPLASKGQTDQVVYDTVFADGKWSRTSVMYTYVAEERLTVGEEILDVTKLTRRRTSESSTNETVVSEAEIYFSSKLGHYVLWKTFPYGPGYYGDETKLNSFVLK